MHRFKTLFAIIIFFSVCIFWATASDTAAGSISLKFEDNLASLKSLSCDSTHPLLPLHTVAHFFKIDMRWSPEREEVILSKDYTEARIILGSNHALIESRYNGSLLQPLLSLPQMLQGSVVVSPQDAVAVLCGMMPYMDISWDEAKATIEAKEREGAPRNEFQQGINGFDLKTIVIDAGHGGRDPGANRRGIKEKTIVLDIAQRLKKLIQANSPWKVVMTRDSDRYPTLRDRTVIANRYPASSTIFISIHCNANRSSRPRGVSTFIFGEKASDAETAELVRIENADAGAELAHILSHCYQLGNQIKNLEFARKVQSTLSKDLSLVNRGVKRGPFYVIKWTKMTSILVELGFVSNASDRARLLKASFRQNAAESLFDAIRQFHGSTSKSIVKAEAKNG